jgi:hypothetical protein
LPVPYAMGVQDRQVSPPFRSQSEAQNLPLDNDSKKNLESHRPVDLLADRSADTFSQWLRAHHSVNPFVRKKSLSLVVGDIGLYTGS